MSRVGNRGVVLTAAGPNMGRGTEARAGTSWLPPSWNQPCVHGRTADNSYNSAAHSYLTRPTVPDPHAVHFMGMPPTARHEHMERLAASLDADGAASAG